MKGPVVLVGHSWGGTVITEAGNDPNVRALVYVAAFAPDAGQSTGDQVGAHEAPPGLTGVTDIGNGKLMMSVESWISNVAQDLPEGEARLLAAVQTPLGLPTFNDKVTQTAWSDRSTFYVVSTEDRAVSVELQRELAIKMTAKTTELHASHMSLLSAPAALAEVIYGAVMDVSI
ncbi:alpha/beta hydrolase [Agrobacterium vitis]